MAFSSSSASAQFLGYRDHVLQPLPPSLTEDGHAGFDNPATTALASGSSLEVTAPLSDADRGGQPRVGLFGRLGGLGFGMLRWHTPGGSVAVDSRASLGFGGPLFALGLGYGWSNRSPEERKDHWKTGFVWRPLRHLSLAATRTWATKGAGGETTGEVGLRPLGNEHVTLFIDANRKTGRPDSWSAGAVSRVANTVEIFTRYGWSSEGKSFTAGIGMDVGPRIQAFETVVSPKDGDRKQKPLVASLRLSSQKREGDDVSPFQMSYARLTLRKAPPDRKPTGLAAVLAEGDVNTLWETLSSLEMVRTSPRFAGVYVELKGQISNLEKAWELREKLLEIKRSGKKVIVYLEAANMANYLVASVGDKVILAPYSDVSLIGFSRSRTYAKRMLEKVGVGLQEFRFLKFKSAVETFGRNSMSEGEREQSQQMVDSFLESWKGAVVHSRPQLASKLNEIINSPLLTSPEEAKKVGLVDVIGTSDSFEDVAKSLEKSTPRLADLPRSSEGVAEGQGWGGAPRVAIVSALGEVSLDDGMKARELARLLQRLEDQPEVKAVVLRVDSPGGDPLAAEIINKAIADLKKERGIPVVISQGSVAASGGFWLALNGDTVFTSPFTITGSIGVISAWFHDAGVGEKIGLSADTVKAGKYSDRTNGLALPFLGEFIPLRKLDKDEESAVYSSMKEVYRDFVRRVAVSRKQSEDDIEKVAQGRVWSGSDALKVRLVDRLGGLDAAVDEALRQAGLKRDQVSFDQLPASSLWRFSELRQDLVQARVQGASPLRDLVSPEVRFRMVRNGLSLAMLPLSEIP